jgi:hypothetical protein
MNRKAMTFTLLVISALLLASCAAIADSQVNHTSIENRLEKLDAFKQTIPARPAALAGELSALSFRSVAFGSTMTSVKAVETQPLANSYSNALDFEPVSFYSYSMQPTYWFNETGQLYSGSYSMQHSDYAAIAQDLQSRLTADFGQPAEVSYYDYSYGAVTFASGPEAQAAIDSGDTYYFVSYADSDGLTIELYVQGASAGGYEFYIYFTDPAFMN